MNSSVVYTVLVTRVLCVEDCNQDGPSSFVGAVLANRCTKRQLQLRWTEFYSLYSVLVTGVLRDGYSSDGQSSIVCTVCW